MITEAKYARERRRVWELRKQLRRLLRLHHLWETQAKFERSQAHKWRDMFHAELERPRSSDRSQRFDFLLVAVMSFILGLFLGPGLLWVIR